MGLSLSATSLTKTFNTLKTFGRKTVAKNGIEIYTSGAKTLSVKNGNPLKYIERDGGITRVRNFENDTYTTITKSSDNVGKNFVLDKYDVNGLSSFTFKMPRTSKGVIKSIDLDLAKVIIDKPNAGYSLRTHFNTYTHPDVSCNSVPDAMKRFLGQWDGGLRPVGANSIYAETKLDNIASGTMRNGIKDIINRFWHS